MLSPELVDQLKTQGPAILAWLTPLWRVAILEPVGRTIEVDAPSGFPLPVWQGYAEHYHGPGCTVTAIAGLPKALGQPVPLDEALRDACEGLAGITQAQFRALLSPDDLADIKAGAIHRKTLGAYALSFADGMRSGRIARAAPPGV